MRRAQSVNYDFVLGGAYDWIDATPSGSQGVDSAAFSFTVIEYAEAFQVAKSDVAVFVIVREIQPVVAVSLQTFDIVFGKKHFRFFAADSAAGTAHESI